MKKKCIALTLVWMLCCGPLIFGEEDPVNPASPDPLLDELPSDVIETRRSEEDSLLDEKETLEDNFSGHEPIYMLFGIDPASAKFQLSFKYRLFSKNAPLAQKWEDIPRFHFAYTQTSFWDLESTSKPFEDNNYKPELLYYRERIPLPQCFEWISRFNFQYGVQHESNGRDGEFTRSLNIAYIRPELVFGSPGDNQFQLSPKFWLYVGDLEENPDIAEYRGYMDFFAKYGKADDMQLSCNARVGSKFDKGSLQLDFSYPLKKLFRDNLDLFLQVQYFTGYGESLLRYDEKSTRVRVGFAIFR